MSQPEDNTEKPAFRWSFSQWEMYNQCPAKWRFRHQLRLPSAPPGPAAARGLELHDRVERYITNRVDTLEPEMGLRFADKPAARVAPKYIPILNEFRDHPNGDRHAEKKLAFDSEWYLCAPQSKHAACIAVLDAARYLKPTYEHTGVLHIGEWKSGKPKDTHADQRKLYAMFGMRAWLADEVHVTTYYLELPNEAPQRITLKSQSGYEKLQELWQGRIDLMQRDKICAPKPSFGCTFCDYAKGKGGPCIFG